MDEQQKNRTKLWATGGGLVLVVALVAYALMTSGPGKAPEAPGAGTLNPVTIGKADPNLAFSEADKAEITAMVADGRIKKFLKDSHEVWVDPDFWKSCSEPVRKRLVLLSASVNRDYDGTRQISVKEAGSDMTIAEYFAGNLRIEP